MKNTHCDVCKEKFPRGIGLIVTEDNKVVHPECYKENTQNSNHDFFYGDKLYGDARISDNVHIFKE